ncbi:orotidine-5'-phosphate decarboxylase [soil metagenome]
MTRQQLFEQIKQKRSFLLVGLDTELAKLPVEFKEMEDPIYEYNKVIIDATQDLCVGYKLNTAFYEAHGAKGWESMRKTAEYIPQGLFKLADAKRGDIGNTSKMYAEAFFKNMDFDAITLSPYMGHDSVMPYLEYEGKWAIMLGLTSNPGSQDLQMLQADGLNFFEPVLKAGNKWGDAENVMFVVGATHPEMFATVRKHAPDNFLLVPGIGAQGGDLREVCKFGMNDTVGLLVAASRSIIFATKEAKLVGEKAREAAREVQREMDGILAKAGI